MSSTKPVFLYFDVTGRAMPARIALFAAFGKDGWVNEAIDFASFGEEKRKLAEGKSDARLVSGSLPQLTLPSKPGCAARTYCQTMSIARWACSYAQTHGLADITDLYPSQDPDKLIVMDEAITFAMEILDRCPQESNADAKKIKREEYASADGFMTRAMRVLETRLGEAEGDFLLGNEPCLADFTIHGLALMISSGNFDYVPASYLNRFPRLLKHIGAVPGCALVKRYVEAYGKQP